MKEIVESILSAAFEALSKENSITLKAPPNFSTETPKEEKFGDYSSNIAMILAKSEGKPPFTLAELFANKIRAMDNGRTFKTIEAVKPGFINFSLSDDALLRQLSDINKKGDRYGQQKNGRGQRVLIEFVSANPTGPLHVGHGRWAAIGDALASIMEAVGYKVDREYYVNDVGRQVDLLKQSVIARSLDREIPEGGYGGGYVIDLANRFKGKLSDKDLSSLLIRSILLEQKAVLELMGVKFNKWFYESSLYKGKKVEAAVKKLMDKQATFIEDGALWFKSKEHGDDKNRVLLRKGGQPTYFASDIAYHADKFARRYDLLIDVWGTDHHGYVTRLKAALKVMGQHAEKLKIIIGQLVSLFRSGEQVKMSKRAGEMVTLKEVIDEIGPDATRFFFLMLSADSHLDFDLELAKKHSMDNPVYYVQYAHARISSILSEAKKAGFDVSRAAKSARLSLLKDEAEFALIKKLASYPDELLEAASSLLPHRIINYSRDLSATFHNFYHRLRVITSDKPLTEARLSLVFAARIVLKNVLKLLNISAPDKM
jgi:arginyl-tRNA synthetase